MGGRGETQPDMVCEGRAFGAGGGGAGGRLGFYKDQRCWLAVCTSAKLA